MGGVGEGEREGRKEGKEGEGIEGTGREERRRGGEGRGPPKGWLNQNMRTYRKIFCYKKALDTIRYEMLF